MNTANVTLSNSDKISLVSNLATMLTAGIPLYEAVESLREDSRGGVRRILDEFKTDLSQGKHIWTTLAKFPRVFDKVTVNVVRASEEAGTLDVTLRDLRESIRKEIEFTDKVKSSLLYPVFIVVVFFLVFFVMLFVVIPRVASVFMRLRVELPLPTKILIFLSNSVTTHVLEVGLGAAAIAGVLFFILKQKRTVLAQLFFKLPFVRTIVAEIDLTRFARSMYLLLYSGIPITAALELAAEVVIRRETARVIRKSHEMLLSGKKLSEGLQTSRGYIPGILIKLVEAGEKTGSLDRSMSDIADYFDYQVTQTLKTVTALLEPVMLVVVGLVIGGMMVAIVAPIYSLMSKVGTR